MGKESSLYCRGRGCRAGLRTGACVQGERCVHTGSMGIFLPNGTERIPKSGWV